MTWDARLIEAGVEITPVDARHLRLRHNGEELIVRLVRTTRKLHPSDVPKPPEHPSLLVAQSASVAAAEKARAAGWSLATEDGPTSIRFSDRHVLNLSGSTRPPQPPPARPGRTPWATMAVVRRLLLNAPAPQTRLATAVGVTQARVSQIFEPLKNERLVRRTRQGWEPAEWDALCDWWLTHYPGPGGISMWWSGLDSPTAQAATAVRVLNQGTPVVSGDVAADLIAPWRRPTQAVVYVRRGASLAETNLSHLPSDEGATLAVIVPEDDSVWPTELTYHNWQGTQLAPADGLQVLYDLHRSPGPDASEAASRWRAHLRESVQA